MKAKRLPRLWCALQGLLPLEACRAAELGELAWPPGLPAEATAGRVAPAEKGRKHVATRRATVNVRRRGSV